MKNTFYVLSIILLGLSCTQAPNSSAYIPDIASTTGNQPMLFNLENWLSKNSVPTTEVTVLKDHSLKSQKKYRAYPFAEIIRAIAVENKLDTQQLQVVFECKDGYSPSNSYLELMEAGGGFLAFKDLEAKNGKDWPDDLQAGYPPYYLVWENIEYGNHKLAWPYGLNRLRLIEEDIYATIRPVGDPHIEKGFELYQKNCIKCHALNGIGGILGPEFNYPKNVTEYWERSNIIAFAKNPYSFRANSRMYAITDLSDDAFEAILDYLTFIADYKIQE